MFYLTAHLKILQYFSFLCLTDSINPKIRLLRSIYLVSTSRGGGGGGTPHMKVVGMLVVSLKGINFAFWSHLGCSGPNAIIFSREGLV